MPPDMRGLEIFLADTAELSGSVGVALLAAAAVAPFCALEGYLSSFERPRFGKIMRGIRNSYIKPVRPKKPFTREHIVKFMDHTRSGLLVDWRSALPMALCFQQLLRGAEAFDLHGGNISVHVGHFLIEVETSKNHPEGFSFKLPIDPERSHCVGTFLADYEVKMGITLGYRGSFLWCKLSAARGILSSVPSVKVSPATMRASCKKLILAVRLDASLYATNSCKRGRALAALEAGLTDAQVQDLGRWSSSSIVARYASGNPDVRMANAEVICI
jgi:hypothetical protein